MPAPNWYPADGLPARLSDLPAVSPTTGLVDNDGSAAGRLAASLNRRIVDRATGTVPTLRAAEEHYGSDHADARRDAEWE